MVLLHASYSAEEMVGRLEFREGDARALEAPDSSFESGAFESCCSRGERMAKPIC